MARSKNISTPPIKKKPPPEQKATPISVAKSLCQPWHKVRRPPHMAPQVACERVVGRGEGAGWACVLWASDNHIDGILGQKCRGVRGERERQNKERMSPLGLGAVASEERGCLSQDSAARAVRGLWKGVIMGCNLGT